MFTGIIETMGAVDSVSALGSGKSFVISSTLTPELKADQSVAHDGVCLTIEGTLRDRYRVTAIQETLERTNLTNWKPGHPVNLERCLLMNGRLDGHIVQGHVDTTGICTQKKDLGGSWEYRFEFDHSFAAWIVDKGSVCVNGISLTAFDVTKSSFSVAIVPYTLSHTNIGFIGISDTANLEFDLVGKYIQRIASLK